MAHNEKILDASRKHPIVELQDGKSYSYGTAGFRMNSELLSGVTFRVGLLASLRSRKLDGQAVGVMMTASHNPAPDNGVKIVDPAGEMLEQEWEEYATDLVNCATHDDLVAMYNRLADRFKIDLSAAAKVVYGRDTRPSGHTLAGVLADALDATSTAAVDHKIVTTPQLHYLVRATNTDGTPLSFGKPTETGYYEKLSAAFLRCLGGRHIQGPLTVDCANGVGAPKLSLFLKHLHPEAGLVVNVVNDSVHRPELLNRDSGSDFVKTKQRPPPGPQLMAANARCCSFDGDVDRIIYYYTDPMVGFVLLDGDRIASLAASFIVDLVRSAGLDDSLRAGVVQTAYANGASTKFVQEHLRLPVVCTPTGVKHLHQAACKFDIGVYFEANGHGTVLFSPDALAAFREKEPQSPAQKDALETLDALANMINQTVGDAISDMLLVEVVLAHKAWTLKEWSNTYADLPNRLVRVEVGDKDLFHATDAERKLSRPPGAQQEIDDVVQKYTKGRSFARASGTENACRVYAEAATITEAEELAQKVASIVRIYGSA